MSDDETSKPAAPPDIEAVRAERKAAKRQAQAERRAAKPAAAPEAQAQRAQRKAAKRQAKEAKKTKTPDTEAAKAQRKAAKQQAKEAKKSKTPDTEAAKAQRKAAKREAKEAAKAAREAKAAEALAARAERKTGKRQAKEAEKVKAPEVLAAKAERKAAKQAAKPEKPPQAKAERKAAKQQAKETKKAETPEQLAAKAERKAAKQQAKEAKKVKTPEELAAIAERKAAKQAAKPEKPPQAKAERKAAKQQAKGAKKAETPEQLAAKAERKAAKQQAKEAKKVKTPEELAAIAERKAAKQAAKPEKSPDAKAERKAAKQTKEAKKVKTAEDLAAKAERKAAKQQAKEAATADAEKAAKKQAKAERKAGKAEKSPQDAAAKAERKAKKAAAKAAGSDGASEGVSHKERKAAKAEKRAAKSKARGDGEGGERSVRLSVAGASPEEVTPLGTALQAAFTAVGAPTEAPKPEGKADLIVHTFDDMGDDANAATVERYAAVVAGQKARVHVFVETLEEGADTGRAIARLAALNGGAVVSTRARLKRFGLDETSSGGHSNEKKLANEKGLALIAQAIVGIGAARLTKHSVNPPAGEMPGDLAEARAAAQQPMELLAKLRWSSMTPPRAVAGSIREDDVVAFADSKVVFSEEASLALATPVDWSVELPDRKANYIFNGLDFLSGPLAYWYAKANNQGSDRTAAIDAALKERGSNPNALLARATQIVVDFIARHPRSTAPKLWEEELVLRRAPVLAMFVLCCRVAYRRKLKFNESAFTLVYNALLDHAEMLRADDFYVPCSVDGLKQDSLTIGIALSLRGTAYGNLLLSDTLERLKRLQLGPGLSAEGVWMGDSYGTHNSALAEITGLFGDFPPSETALLEPLAAAAKKMTLFSEAMLKSNGQPPAFDGSKEKAYGNKISGMRKSIARAGGKQVSAGKTTLKTRITDTYVFREAQYFISHSQQKVVPESSLVVLHAAAPSVVHEDPGGVKLVFAYNETNLLIRAEPPQAQGEDEPDETDPGLRNFYRIAGRGNLVPESGSNKTAQMVKSWRGPGWAAAKAFENNYDGACVARTVIHLKARHALIVVDELESDKEALFEQFWNVGPDFTAPATMEMPLRFTSDGKGVLSAVLAGAQGVSATKGETATSLRGELLLTQDVVAALFQWTDEAADAALAIERRGAGEWAVTASGKGFSARLNYAGNELTCELTGE